MSDESVSFDTETITFLRATLDETWASLSPQQQALFGKSDLAHRILKLAAEGERDPVRLRSKALIRATRDK